MTEERDEEAGLALLEGGATRVGGRLAELTGDRAKSSLGFGPSGVLGGLRLGRGFLGRFHGARASRPIPRGGASEADRMIVLATGEDGPGMRVQADVDPAPRVAAFDAAVTRGGPNPGIAGLAMPSSRKRTEPHVRSNAIDDAVEDESGWGMGTERHRAEPTMTARLDRLAARSTSRARAGGSALSILTRAPQRAASNGATAWPARRSPGDFDQAREGGRGLSDISAAPSPGEDRGSREPLQVVVLNGRDLADGVGRHLARGLDGPGGGVTGPDHRASPWGLRGGIG